MSSYSDWPEELQQLIGQLRLYNERLTDFTQAQVLQGLGRGVDVQRFSSDPDYKKETILGLTESVWMDGWMDFVGCFFVCMPSVFLSCDLDLEFVNKSIYLYTDRWMDDVL